MRRLLLLLALAAFPAAAQTPPVLTVDTVTPAAQAEEATLCNLASIYPTPWTFQGGSSPVSATSGTPKIEQYRGGALVATYASWADGPDCIYKGDGSDNLDPGAPAASGCGPFTRVHSWRLWAPGDKFLVYPAVYSGEIQQPWFGPEFDGPAQYDNGEGIPTPLTGVTITGVVQNNQRPVIMLVGNASNNTYGQGAVYFDVSDGLTFSNINVVAGANAWVGKAGIYEVAGSHLTISDVRVSGFEYQQSGGMGIFGAAGYSGWLHMRRVELDHNGGTNGPEHNAYINASVSDPDFTVDVRNSWSHDAYYGHLFKSRARHNVFVANFFDGGVPQGGPIYTQAENYLLDIPNGGTLIAKNNVFSKKESGTDSNGMSITYAMEGVPDGRAMSVNIQFNTFIQWAYSYDGVHQIYPMNFYYPSIVPGSPAWPKTVPVKVKNNAYFGVCGGSPVVAYRGVGITESLNTELGKVNLHMLNPWVAPPPAGGDGIVGTGTYAPRPALGNARSMLAADAFDYP